MITSADQRLGLHSADEIKSHPFFAGVDWATIRNIESPFIPQLRCVFAGLLPLRAERAGPHLRARCGNPGRACADAPLDPLAQLAHRHVLLPDRGPQRRAGAAFAVGRRRRDGPGRQRPHLARVHVQAVRGRAEPLGLVKRGASTSHSDGVRVLPIASDGGRLTTRCFVLAQSFARASPSLPHSPLFLCFASRNAMSLPRLCLYARPFTPSTFRRSFPCIPGLPTSLR